MANNNIANVNKNDLGFLGEEYQKLFVKCLIEDKQYFGELYSVLDQNKFTNENLRRIVGFMKDRYAEVEIAPSYSDLKVIIRSRVSDEISRNIMISMLKEIYNLKMESIDLIEDTCFKFFKQQNLIKALKETEDIIRMGDFNRYNEIVEKIQKAIETNEKKDLGFRLFENLESDLSEDYRITIPTGADKLDDALYGGIGKGQLGIIISPMGTGKAQPLTSKVLTPNGFKTMGDMHIGSEVIGYDGKPHKVIGVFPQGIRPVYKLTFSDGSVVECDENHLWNVNTYYQRTRKTYVKGSGAKNSKKKFDPDYTFKTWTLKDMINRGIYKTFPDGRTTNVFKVPKNKVILFKEQEITVDPYVLGYFIGDGCASKLYITVGEQDIDNFKKNTSYIPSNEINIVRVNNRKIYTVYLKSSLRKGIKEIFDEKTIRSHNKFIPEEYKINSKENRIALLQGLLDSDGTVDKKGTIEYCTKSKKLADDVIFLVKSLGGYAHIGKKNTKYYSKKYDKSVDCGIIYRIWISFTDESIKPFRLERKMNRVRYRNKYLEEVYITKVEYDRQDYTQCILIDSDDHLYLTDDFIVTHNTSATTGFAANAAITKCKENDYKGWKVLHIFFEDTEVDIRRKYYGFFTDFDAMYLSDPQIKELALEKMNEDQEKRQLMYENIKAIRMESMTTTASDIEALIKREIAVGFKPDMVIIDYFECLAPERIQYSKADTWEKEGITIRKLEKMTNKYNIAIWIPVQGNRESIGLDKVGLAQGGGSIKKTQAAHVVITFAQTDDQKTQGRMNIFLAKLRSGKITRNQFYNVAFNNGTCKFDMSNIDADTSAIENANDMERDMEIAAAKARAEAKNMITK